MKPTIPETGTVLKLDRDTAVVLLKGGTSCKGCGAGKMGLCRPAGDSMMITVKNTASASIGDTVVIGIDRRVQRAAYLLAYGAPLVSFIAGSFCGHVAGEYLSIHFLDAAAGFATLVVTSVYSFLRLRKLDSSSMMTVKHVIREYLFDTDAKTDEEQRYGCYAANPRG